MSARRFIGTWPLSCVAVLCTCAVTAGSAADSAADTRAPSVARAGGEIPSPVWAELATLDDAQQRNARILLEMPVDAAPWQTTMAAQAEALWNRGRHDDAIRMVRVLEDSGLSLGVCINWIEPIRCDAPGTRATDVRIGYPRTGAIKAVLDRWSINVFALVQWPLRWTMNVSTDGGVTWYETCDTYSANGFIDVDATVGDLYVYVGYIRSASPEAARIARFYVTSGNRDEAYGFPIAFSEPSGLSEVALACDDDDMFDRLYCLALGGDTRVHCAWTTAYEGEPFDSITPFYQDITGGLDAATSLHWGTPDGVRDLFVSVVRYSDTVCVLHHRTIGTQETWGINTVEENFTGANAHTAVAAKTGMVYVAYEHAFVNGQGIRLRTSEDAGYTWSFGTLAAPEPGENYQMVDLTARGEIGPAAVYTREYGEPDSVFFQNDFGFLSGAWNNPARINEDDVFTGTPTSICPMILDYVPDPDIFHYGMVYLSGDWPDLYPMFDRKDGQTSPGNDCTNAVGVTIPFHLPYSDANTTCDRGNDYEQTCMASYDWGADLIYKATVTATTSVDITLDADTDWAGVAVFSACPIDDPDSCIATATTSSNPDVIENLELAPGVYYIMVDTFPPPECCDVTLSITEAGFCPADVNADGVVNVLDLLAVIAAWGGAGGPEDVNGDGIVDVLDLLAVISAWGPCP